MTVEVLASAVVDRGRAGIRVSGGELHLSKRHAGIECGHDERSTEHVWVDVAEAGALVDRLHPSMPNPTVETLSIVADEDRSFTAFADREVHGAGGSWDKRDHGGLVAIAKDAESAVAPVAAEITDVGAACLADRRPLTPRARVAPCIGGTADQVSVNSQNAA